MKFLETKFFFIAILIMIPIELFYNSFLSENYLNQILFFLIPLIWPGLAHGSLDITIAEKNGIINNNIELIFFVFVYILIPSIFFLLWLSVPNIIFIIFLAFSMLHFGISDNILKKRELLIFEIPLRGILVISLPFTFHLDKSIEIFSYFLVEKEFIEKLIPIFDYLNFFLLFWASVFVIRNYSNFLSSLKQFIFIIEIVLIFFCFWYFEPLLSFFIYFCFLHSSRHLIDEKINLSLSLKELILKTIPMTMLTLLFFLGVLFFYEDKSSYKQISYIVIGLSSLTISHIFLVNFTKIKS